MTQEDFKIGTLVRLKGQTGSPIMTSVGFNHIGSRGFHVQVHYWKTDTCCFKKEEFPYQSLDKISNEEIEAIAKIRKKNYDNPSFLESNDVSETKEDIEQSKPIEKTIFEMIKQKFNW